MMKFEDLRMCVYADICLCTHTCVGEYNLGLVEKPHTVRGVVY